MHSCEQIITGLSYDEIVWHIKDKWQTFNKKYAHLNRPISKARTAEWIDFLRRLLKKSKYAVERSFNSLPKAEKQLVLALCHFNKNDTHLYTQEGDKLSDYTATGRQKIAEAVKLIRSTAKGFPPLITAQEFQHIDKEVNP